jgi:hypothetical protein
MRLQATWIGEELPRQWYQQYYRTEHFLAQVHLLLAKSAV